MRHFSFSYSGIHLVLLSSFLPYCIACEFGVLRVAFVLYLRVCVCACLCVVCAVITLARDAYGSCVLLRNERTQRLLVLNRLNICNISHQGHQTLQLTQFHSPFIVLIFKDKDLSTINKRLIILGLESTEV